MPNIDDMGTSRFLKKEDCDTPITVTVDHVEKQDVSIPGEPREEKWCLFFQDGVKPMVLNSTNRKLIARALGSKETDKWTGKDVELYHDPNVTFAGEFVGGIRARKARSGTNGSLVKSVPRPRPTVPMSQAAAEPEFDENEAFATETDPN